MAVVGKSQNEHDKHVQVQLERCCTLKVKLNLEKLEVGLDSITFTGHHITKDGIVADLEKIRAIQDMTVPEIVRDLCSFLDMPKYVGKFVLNLTTIIKSLQDLTKKDVPWMWSGFQQVAFDTVKNVITNLL